MSPGALARSASVAHYALRRSILSQRGATLGPSSLHESQATACSWWKGTSGGSSEKTPTDSNEPSDETPERTHGPSKHRSVSWGPDNQDEFRKVVEKQLGTRPHTARCRLPRQPSSLEPTPETAENSDGGANRPLSSSGSFEIRKALEQTHLNEDPSVARSRPLLPGASANEDLEKTNREEALSSPTTQREISNAFEQRTCIGTQIAENKQQQRESSRVRADETLNSAEHETQVRLSSELAEIRDASEKFVNDVSGPSPKSQHKSSQLPIVEKEEAASISVKTTSSLNKNYLKMSRHALQLCGLIPESTKSSSVSATKQLTLTPGTDIYATYSQRYIQTRQGDKLCEVSRKPQTVDANKTRNLSSSSKGDKPPKRLCYTEDPPSPEKSHKIEDTKVNYDEKETAQDCRSKCENKEDIQADCRSKCEKSEDPDCTTPTPPPKSTEPTKKETKEKSSELKSDTPPKFKEIAKKDTKEESSKSKSDTNLHKFLKVNDKKTEAIKSETQLRDKTTPKENTKSDIKKKEDSKSPVRAKHQEKVPVQEKKEHSKPRDPKELKQSPSKEKHESKAPIRTKDKEKSTAPLKKKNSKTQLTDGKQTPSIDTKSSKPTTHQKTEMKTSSEESKKKESTDTRHSKSDVSPSSTTLKKESKDPSRTKEKTEPHSHIGKKGSMESHHSKHGKPSGTNEKQSKDPSHPKHSDDPCRPKESKSISSIANKGSDPCAPKESKSTTSHDKQPSEDPCRPKESETSTLGGKKYSEDPCRPKKSNSSISIAKKESKDPCRPKESKSSSSIAKKEFEDPCAPKESKSSTSHDKRQEDPCRPKERKPSTPDGKKHSEDPCRPKATKSSTSIQKKESKDPCHPKEDKSPPHMKKASKDPCAPKESKSTTSHDKRQEDPCRPKEGKSSTSIAKKDSEDPCAPKESKSSTSHDKRQEDPCRPKEGKPSTPDGKKHSEDPRRPKATKSSTSIQKKESKDPCHPKEDKSLLHTKKTSKDPCAPKESKSTTSHGKTQEDPCRPKEGKSSTSISKKESKDPCHPKETKSLPDAEKVSKDPCAPKESKSFTSHDKKPSEDPCRPKEGKSSSSIPKKDSKDPCHPKETKSLPDAEKVSKDPCAPRESRFPISHVKKIIFFRSGSAKENKPTSQDKKPSENPCHPKGDKPLTPVDRKGSKDSSTKESKSSTPVDKKESKCFTSPKEGKTSTPGAKKTAADPSHPKELIRSSSAEKETKLICHAEKENVKFDKKECKDFCDKPALQKVDKKECNEFSEKSPSQAIKKGAEKDSNKISPGSKLLREAKSKHATDPSCEEKSKSQCRENTRFDKETCGRKSASDHQVGAAKSKTASNTKQPPRKATESPCRPDNRSPHSSPVRDAKRPGDAKQKPSSAPVSRLGKMTQKARKGKQINQSDRKGESSRGPRDSSQRSSKEDCKNDGNKPPYAVPKGARGGSGGVLKKALAPFGGAAGKSQGKAQHSAKQDECKPPAGGSSDCRTVRWPRDDGSDPPCEPPKKSHWRKLLWLSPLALAGALYAFTPAGDKIKEALGEKPCVEDKEGNKKPCNGNGKPTKGLGTRNGSKFVASPPLAVPEESDKPLETRPQSTGTSVPPPTCVNCGACPTCGGYRNPSVAQTHDSGGNVSYEHFCVPGRSYFLKAVHCRPTASTGDVRIQEINDGDDLKSAVFRQGVVASVCFGEIDGGAEFSCKFVPLRASASLDRCPVYTFRGLTKPKSSEDDQENEKAKVPSSSNFKSAHRVETPGKPTEGCVTER